MVREETVFEVEGMSCSSCAARLQRQLAATEGVIEAHVEFATRSVRVVFDPELVPGLERLREVVRSAGFMPVANEENAAPWWRGPLGYAGLTGGLLVAGWLVGLEAMHHHRYDLEQPRAWWSLALVTASLLMSGIPLLRKGVRDIWAREITADVLVLIAVVAACSIGQIIAAAEVAFILLLGEELESWTLGRARRHLGAALRLVPVRATLLEGDQEREVAVAKLKIGQRIRVRPGERVPADGRVEAGRSELDASAVTGESLPAVVEPGGLVYAGSVNGSGALVVEVVAAGEDSTVGKIARLVRDAQESAAPIQRVCDRYARWVVPLMIALSVITLAVMKWGLDANWSDSLYRAVTVLIVACPCALVLATPVAVVAAIARSARDGIIFKGGAVVEAMGRVTDVVFDKTGTLTWGRLRVTKLYPASGVSETELVATAVTAEVASEHPVARAIVAAAKDRGVPIVAATEVQAVPGWGVEAQTHRGLVRVGRSAWLQEKGCGTPPDEGTSVGVVIAEKFLGWIVLEDEIRSEAAEAVRQLRAAGVERVHLLSGDRQSVAVRVAEKVGIGRDGVEAEVLPHEKLERVRALQAQGRSVAMVGDGINDAAALAGADAGIAMGLSGADVANEAARVALMSHDLRKIPFAVRMGRAMLRVIRQGMGFAVVFNTVMISMAMHGDLPIWMAALAHQGSSLLVILNAMRLLRIRGTVTGSSIAQNPACMKDEG
jgi:Cd2+/Zn2+-exporting ATPase